MLVYTTYFSENITQTLSDRFRKTFYNYLEFQVDDGDLRKASLEFAEIIVGLRAIMIILSNPEFSYEDIVKRIKDTKSIELEAKIFSSLFSHYKDELFQDKLIDSLGLTRAQIEDEDFLQRSYTLLANSIHPIAFASSNIINYKFYRIIGSNEGEYAAKMRRLISTAFKRFNAIVKLIKSSESKSTQKKNFLKHSFLVGKNQNQTIDKPLIHDPALGRKNGINILQAFGIVGFLIKYLSEYEPKFDISDLTSTVPQNNQELESLLNYLELIISSGSKMGPIANRFKELREYTQELDKLVKSDSHVPVEQQRFRQLLNLLENEKTRHQYLKTDLQSIYNVQIDLNPYAKLFIEIDKLLKEITFELEKDEMAQLSDDEVQDLVNAITSHLSEIGDYLKTLQEGF